MHHTIKIKPRDSLQEALATIPSRVTSLNLTHNGLGERTGTELAQAFAAIPSNVTSLDLGLNSLGKRAGAELAQDFAAISLLVLHH